MAIVPKKGVLGHFFGVLVVLAGIVAPGTLAADPCSDVAPVRSLRRLTQTPVEYLQSTKLTAVDGAANDHFGYSLSIDGDTIVIGAYADDDKATDSGSAYVFTRNRCWNETTGDVSSNYTQVAKLTADDGAQHDSFGSSVSIDGDTIVIGAKGDDDKGTDSGSAHVFTRDTAGDLASGWTQVTKLVADDGASGDYFGRFVYVDSGMILIGAFYDDDKGANSGSAYVFTLASESTSIRPCTCCEFKIASRGFNKAACNPELFAVPYCPIVE